MEPSGAVVTQEKDESQKRRSPRVDIEFEREFSEGIYLTRRIARKEGSVKGIFSSIGVEHNCSLCNRFC